MIRRERMEIECFREQESRTNPTPNSKSGDTPSMFWRIKRKLPQKVRTAQSALLVWTSEDSSGDRSGMAWMTKSELMQYYHWLRMWCRRPDLNRHGPLSPRDFKSLASACSATPAWIRWAHGLYHSLKIGARFSRKFWGIRKASENFYLSTGTFLTNKKGDANISHPPIFTRPETTL